MRTTSMTQTRYSMVSHPWPTLQLLCWSPDEVVDHLLEAHFVHLHRHAAELLHVQFELNACAYVRGLPLRPQFATHLHAQTKCGNVDGFRD